MPWYCIDYINIFLIKYFTHNLKSKVYLYITNKIQFSILLQLNSQIWALFINGPRGARGFGFDGGRKQRKILWISYISNVLKCNSIEYSSLLDRNARLVTATILAYVATVLRLLALFIIYNVIFSLLTIM